VAPRQAESGEQPVPRQSLGTSGLLQLTGRTTCDRIVVFDGTPRQIGQILPIRIYDANAFTLFGEVVTQHVGPEVYALKT
jgi:tRNA-2-methylthio-N6-dimethylallyladenosine synthase